MKNNEQNGQNKQDKKNKKKIKDALFNKIPYKRCFFEDGMIETEEGMYSKCYLLSDKIKKSTRDTGFINLNRKFRDFLNNIPDNARFQFVIHNKLVSEDYFFDRVLIDPNLHENITEQIDDYNRVIISNASVGHNNVKKDIYFIILVKADTPDEALSYFNGIDETIKKLFLDTYGITVKPLSLKQRMYSLFSMYNPGKKDFLNGVPDFSYSGLKKAGLTTKDIVSPKSIDSKDSHKDYMVLNDDTYVRLFFINLMPKVISNSIISDITSISSSMLLSIQYENIPKRFGLSVFSDAVLENMTYQVINRRDSLSDRKRKRTEELTSMVEHTEETYFDNEALEVFKKAVAKDSRVYACSITITLYAKDLETLNRDTNLLYISANKFALSIKCLDLLQLEGFSSSLPLGIMKVDVKRIMGLSRLMLMHPVNIQDSLYSGGAFYGLNAINDNLIIFNRKNFANPAGIIAGVEHSGKTFQTKREIFNALISTDDKISILTDSDEYDDFIKQLGGRITDNAGTNMFFAYDYYGMLDNTSYSKSIMLEALFKSILLKDMSLNPEKENADDDIYIEEDVRKLINLVNEGVLSLSQGDKIIDYIEENRDSFKVIDTCTQKLKTLYGEGKKSTSRLELYKVKDLPDFICKTDYLWNQALMDKTENITSWLFIDPVDSLLTFEQGLDYISFISRKCNDLGSVLTMVIKSSVRLISDPKSMIRLEELLLCCGYFKLLNQGAIERRKFSKLLNIPNSLINYLTNVDCGKGLIITPGFNVAFDDNFADSDVDEKFYSMFMGS